MLGARAAPALFDLRVERVRLALAELVAPTEERRREARAERERVVETLRQLARASGADARLATRLHLDPDVVDFLWTAVALEVDPRIVPLAERLVGPAARRGATVALHAAAFALDGARSRALVAALAPGCPLLRAGLLAATGDGVVLPATAFRVPPRVRAHLLGRDEIDLAVRRAGGRVAPVPRWGDDGEQRAVEARLLAALEQGGDVLLVLEGPSGVGKASLVARAAAALGRRVVALDLARWDGRALDALVTAWWRECVLDDALPLVAHLDVAPDGEGRRLALLLDELPGPVAATARRCGGEVALRRALVRLRVPLPDAASRRELWRHALGDAAASVDLDLVARRYRTGGSGVARAVQAARVLAGEATPLDTAAVVAGVRASVEERVGELAVRVPVAQGWDDLVLPRDQLDPIRALVARVRHAHRVLDQWGFARKLPHGQGIAALLSGPPGTGKTMVAGLIARELDLDLLQVDLSRVMSKWIGETEKQLGALFDAGEAGHALLLFDEADALFAKRTEVKGSNDRYANLEVSYLLSRIEAFGGITLLTTNFETAIDPAVRRRLAAHITFWPPGEAERAALWRKMLPPEAPVAGDIDSAALAARFPHMTGAHIRNAAVAAAFLAATEDAALTQEHLERAARAEYHAMGRVLAGAPEREE